MDGRKVAGIFLLMFFTFTLGLGGLAYAAGARSANDHVLNERKYEEYFKQEGNGDKNYLYTVTREVPAPAPGKCIVVSADSEQTIAVACNYGQG